MAFCAEIPFQNPQDGCLEKFKCRQTLTSAGKTRANKISSIFQCSPCGKGKLKEKQQQQKLAKFRAKRKFHELDGGGLWCFHPKLKPQPKPKPIDIHLLGREQTLRHLIRTFTPQRTQQTLEIRACPRAQCYLHHKFVYPT